MMPPEATIFCCSPPHLFGYWSIKFFLMTFFLFLFRSFINFCHLHLLLLPLLPLDAPLYPINTHGIRFVKKCFRLFGFFLYICNTLNIHQTRRVTKGGPWVSLAYVKISSAVIDPSKIFNGASLNRP